MGQGQTGREEKSVDQIIVPLPEGTWPNHIFAKGGTNVFSFTMYEPFALKKVAFEPVLHLSSVEPYAFFARLGESNR